MALTDKDILITPNRGQTDDPKIEFKGADASLGPQTITARMYPTSNGTLSFEGSAGQLFSITNDLSGTIFSVNDVSGIPSIEVNADGTIKLAEFNGNVEVGGNIIFPPVANTGVYFGGATSGNAYGYVREISIGQLAFGSDDAVKFYETDADTLRVDWSLNSGTFNFIGTLQEDGNNVWHAGNDGSGSGLDADLLDGIQGGSFLRSDAADQYDGQVSGRRITFRMVDGQNAASATGNLSPLEIYQASNVANSDAFMTFHISGRHARYFGLDRETNDLFTGGWTLGANKYRIWHEGNDGTGSGLDADTVDGIQGASFLRSDAADTATGAITFSGGITLNSNLTWNTGKNILIGGESSFDLSSGGTFSVWDGGNSTFALKIPYGAQTEIGAAGNRGLKVYGPIVADSYIDSSGRVLTYDFSASASTSIGDNDGYFDVGEALELFSFQPTGNSQNYYVEGTVKIQTGASVQTLFIRSAIRSETRPNMSWTGQYENYSEAGYSAAIPYFWVNKTTGTGEIRLVLEFTANQIHDIECSFKVFQRGAYGEALTVTTNHVTNATLPANFLRYTLRYILSVDASGTTFNDDLRAERFIDSDNSSYYLDPDQGSVLNSLTVGNITSSSGMYKNSNSNATSKTNGAIWLNGDTGSILLDTAAQKRISWNDGGGNFQIRSGVYYNNGEKYVLSNDGAADIEINTDGAAGAIIFKVAGTGSADDTVTWGNTLLLNTEGFTFNGNTIWHAGNDGTGSGLDADTVDGVHGGSFLRSDAADTASGLISFTAAGNQILLKNGTANDPTIIHRADGANYYILLSAAGTTPSAVWNTLRPLTINQTSGLLTSSNGQVFGGNTEVTGGLTVSGSIDSGATNFGLYESVGTNIILKGDSNGRSGIFFQSEQNNTNINHGSDYGFIQFHAHGFGNTTGEVNQLVIGIANDSNDELILQSPYNGGVKVGYKDAASGTGLTTQKVFHDAYHPNADTWTTTRTNTVTLTGDVTGSGSASVNGSGNWTVSFATTVANDSHNHSSSSGNFTVNGVLFTNEIRDRTGQQLVLVAGESEGKVTGQTNEYVYVNAENGLSVNTPDRAHSNWEAGYTVDTAIIQGHAITLNGNTVWHQGNDGAGSGLDADNLDGYTWDSAGKNIRGAEFYTDGWFRNYNSGYGLYNQATTGYFYSDGGYWNVAYSGTGATGIRLRAGSGGTILGYLYAETNQNFGLLNSSGNWAVQCYPGATGGGYLHGVWSVGTDIRAPIFYDSNNTNLRLDPTDQSYVGRLEMSWASSSSWSSTTALLIQRSPGGGNNGSNPGLAFWGPASSYAAAIRLSPGDGSFHFNNSAFNGFINAYANSFINTSDYRLKTDVTEITNAIDDIMGLSPKKYLMVSDNKRARGFIAHEVDIYIPEAVKGEKDAEDEKGFPVYQGLEPTAILSTLVAAFQELKQIIDIQQQEINELKGLNNG